MFAHTEPGTLSPHHDYHPFDLGGLIYIDDVAPNSGGTTLWPQSHRALQQVLPYPQQCGMHSSTEYEATLERVKAEIVPVEVTGGAGDTLFFHPAMVHSRGLNSAATGSGQLRIASPQDWQRAGRPKVRSVESSLHLPWPPA